MRVAVSGVLYSVRFEMLDWSVVGGGLLTFDLTDRAGRNQRWQSFWRRSDFDGIAAVSWVRMIVGVTKVKHSTQGGVLHLVIKSQLLYM
jgi:hypothetical protein